MDILKIVLLVVIVIVVLGASGAIFLSMKSKSGLAPGLINGALAPCPSTPNCVSSELGTPASHSIAPLDGGSWDKLPGAIEEAGGDIIARTDSYIAAEFETPLMRFVDDVEFRKAGDAVHVRSASRVGKSDLGANAKRIEQLRAALSQ